MDSRWLYSNIWHFGTEGQKTGVSWIPLSLMWQLMAPRTSVLRGSKRARLKLQGFYDRASEAPMHYFCHILLVKWVTKASSDSRGGELDSLLMGKVTKNLQASHLIFTWQTLLLFPFYSQINLIYLVTDSQNLKINMLPTVSTFKSLI